MRNAINKPLELTLEAYISDPDPPPSDHSALGQLRYTWEGEKGCRGLHRIRLGSVTRKEIRRGL